MALERHDDRPRPGRVVHDEPVLGARDELGNRSSKATELADEVFGIDLALVAQLS
jgi:hypothetical protein